MTSKRWWFVVKLAISGMILWLVARSIETEAPGESLSRIGLGSYAVLIAGSGVKLWLEYLNWRRYLQMHASYQGASPEIFASLMIGHALRFMIPGGYGVIGKVAFVDQKKSRTAVSVGVEKFFQIWMNLSFAAIAGFFYFTETSLLWRITAIAVIAALPFLPLAIPRLKRIEQSWFRNYSRSLPFLFFTHSFTMLITILQYQAVLHNIAGTGAEPVFIAVPLILSANLIPITFAGLGLREQFAVSVLARYAILPAQAMTASLSVFFFSTVLPALAGVVFLVTYKHKTGERRDHWDDQENDS